MSRSQLCEHLKYVSDISCSSLSRSTQRVTHYWPSGTHHVIPTMLCHCLSSNRDHFLVLRWLSSSNTPTPSSAFSMVYTADTTLPMVCVLELWNLSWTWGASTQTWCCSEFRRAEVGKSHSHLPYSRLRWSIILFSVLSQPLWCSEWVKCLSEAPGKVCMCTPAHRSPGCRLEE